MFVRMYTDTVTVRRNLSPTPIKDFNSWPSKNCFQEIYHILQLKNDFIKAWNSITIKIVSGCSNDALGSPVKCRFSLALSPSCIVSMVASCSPSSSSFAPQGKRSYLTFDLQELWLGSTLLLQVQVHSLVILALRIHIIPLETFVAWKTYHNSLRTRFLCYYSEARDGKKQKGYYN